MTDRTAALTPAQFKAVRKDRGETEEQFARALGYQGSDNNNRRLIRRMESGEKPITPQIAVRAISLRQELEFERRRGTSRVVAKERP